MRLSSALFPLLAASSATAAQQQAPLVDQVKGWFAAASAKASSLAASAPNPVDAGASAMAASQVQPITLRNYASVLAPGAATSSPGLETWLVFVTGGNKTCFGRCGQAELAWNRSVPALSVARQHVRPHLGLINCEAEPVLCGAWAVAPPSIFELKIPQPAADQSHAPTAFRYLKLNATAATAEDLTKLYTEGGFEHIQPYEGSWHPFDGPFAKTGLNVAFGYVAWICGLVPSWLMMIGISMFSRMFLSKRLGPQPQQRPPGAPAPAGGAAARPAAAR